MKSTLILALIIIFSLLVIPLASLPTQSKAVLSTGKNQTDIEYQQSTANTDLEKIRVLADGKTMEYSVKDYIFGVVAAEMPALYHKEALKAQAVAAYTFACYKINADGFTDYDISADPDTAQSFITREQAGEKWGDKADEYTKKIDDCIAEVAGCWLSYEGKPILAAYHAISSGSTNSCAQVWGKDLPYLQSCDSFGDKLANGYLSEAVFSTSEITEKLKAIAAPSGEAQNYFTEITTADNGYVKSITYCGKPTTGAQISKALELRSSCFTVVFADDSFKFEVKGYGHGVGLSQTGADYMAKQGSSYEEILAHYYKGAVLQKN